MKTQRGVDHATARRAALIAGVWAPLAIVVASLAVVVILGTVCGGDLVVHWGSGGARTGPWWTYAVLIAAIGLPVIAGIGFFLARATRMVGMNAWMPAVSMGLTVFHTLGLGVGPVVFNDSTLAPAWPIVGGLLLGIGAGLLTWRLLPQEAIAPSTVEPARSLPVRPGETVAWTGRVSPPIALLALVAAVLVASLVGGVVLVLSVNVRAAGLWVLAAVFLVVLVTTTEFRIAAGPDGLTVRSVVGWPSFHVPAGDIARAGVVQIEALSEFGGWGLRWVRGRNGKGRWGIISRSGPALEVVRKDGRSLVLSTDDAATAAAVLETYARDLG